MKTGLRTLPWRDPGFTVLFVAACVGPICSMALRFVPGHLAAVLVLPVFRWMDPRRERTDHESPE